MPMLTLKVKQRYVVWYNEVTLFLTHSSPPNSHSHQISPWYPIIYIFCVNIHSGPCKDGDIQLAGYSTFGRLEICMNRTWGKLCGKTATHKVASVVCRQLGWSPQGEKHSFVCHCNAVHTSTTEWLSLICAGAILRRTRFSLGSLDYFIANANCTGDEHSLFNCSYVTVNSGRYCDGFEAGVICQGKTK